MKVNSVGGKKIDRFFFFSFLPPMLIDHFHDTGKVDLDATQLVMCMIQGLGAIRRKVICNITDKYETTNTQSIGHSYELV